MLLSHSHRFIFIHIYKTGGISVRAALEPYAELPNWPLWQRLRLRLRLPVCRRPPDVGWHAQAVDVQAALSPDMFQDYFKFAFVRNPWDWQVSLYHYILQYPEHGDHARVSQMDGLEDFLFWRIRHNRQLQKDFVADESGRILVDFVGRFENMKADFASVCARIGIRAGLRHLNPSRHGDYRKYYTPRSRRLVEEYWADDIKLFGYRFDSTRRLSAAGVA
jgi:hypothetical protein